MFIFLVFYIIMSCIATISILVYYTSPQNIPLQDYEEEMARVLEQMRASHETRSLFEQAKEQEELLDQSTTASSSGHTKILPHQEESQAFRALSPLESDGENKEEHAEGVGKSENQS